MHGQKRAEYKTRLRDPVVSKKLEQKAQQWNTLTQTLLQKRQQQQEELPPEKAVETLALTEKLLTVNPDPSYLWNIRRELLVTNNGDFLKQEQILTQTALSNNPKAYGAWFHRKWCIQKYCNDISIDDDKTIMLHAELILCSEFLRLDERNFHCWNYRRFVVGVLMELYALQDGTYNGEWIWKQHADIVFGAQIKSKYGASQVNLDYTNNVDIQELIESEWNFTLEKIEQNFSNGSAFHYRSKLLPIMLNLNTQNSNDVWECKFEYLQQELELIRNAVFTEPDDQTAWWYLRFIITWANPCNHQDEQENKEAMDMFHETLFEEWNMIQELVESEEYCKWALLGLHMISSEMLKLQEAHSFEGDVDWHAVTNDYLERLKQLDIDRLARYESMMK